MKKTKQRVAGIAASAMVASAAIVTPMAVSAATPSSMTASRPRVAGYTIRVERQKAIATVLGTTPDQLEQTLKDTTLKQLIAQKGLSNKDFAQKVRAEVTQELKALGYSDEQINGSLKGGKGGLKKHHGDLD